MKGLKNLIKNEISGVPLSISDKNSSEALFLKDNAKKENETQPKHSKANILANITAQIMKFSVKDFLSKCDQIRSLLRI